MKQNKSAEELQLKLLDDYKVYLKPDGTVDTNSKQVHYDKDVILDYRDEGPDAWASSEFFSGPAWLWTDFEGWNFWEHGVQITGYYGLNATVVNIQKDGVHIIKCRE